MKKQEKSTLNPFSAEAFKGDKQSTFGSPVSENTGLYLKVAALSVLSLASIIVPFMPVVHRFAQMKQLSSQVAQNHKQGQDDQALLALARLYALSPNKKFFDAYGQLITAYLTKRVSDRAWLDSKEWQKDQDLLQRLLNVPGVEQTFPGGANHETFRNFVIATQPIMLLEYAAVIADTQPLQATQAYIDVVKLGTFQPGVPSFDRARMKLLDVAVKNKDVRELLRQNQKGFALIKLMVDYADMDHSLYGTPDKQKQQNQAPPPVEKTTQQKASLGEPAPFTYFAIIRSRQLLRAA